MNMNTGERVISEALLACAERVYAVPGYPVNGLAEKTGAEFVVNENVGMEYALGDSLSGRRAAVIMKNVGINACADPLIQAVTQGLEKGVVLVAGDDLEAAGSQNTQDSRYYGEIAQVPVLEPGQGTCFRSVEEAFLASEMFSRPVIIRLTPDLLFGEAEPDRVKRRDGKGRLADRRLTMKGRSTESDRILADMFRWSADSPLNRLTGGEVGVGAVPAGSQVVTVYPPPAAPSVLAHARELGRPFVREHRFLHPASAAEPAETMEKRGYYRTFCQKCPFKGVFEILKERKMTVIADAGCSILTLNPPYMIGIANYGLGSAVGVAARSTGVALIGDYAILHSGLASLIDVYEKELPLLCIILVNRCMGMTGGQASYDPLRYLEWADPVVISSEDKERLSEHICPASVPRTVVVTGTCPEERHHETMAY